jgi:hypothetical protein
MPKSSLFRYGLCISVIAMIIVLIAPYGIFAQVDWGTNRIIDANTGYNQYEPQVKISGLNACAVWYQSDDDYNNRIYSNYTTNGGVDWGDAQMIDDIENSQQTAPRMAMSGLNVVVVWYGSDWGANNAFYSNYSTDGGITWNTQTVIYEGLSLNIVNPDVAISGDKAVVVFGKATSFFPDLSFTLYSCYSFDKGETWSSPQVISSSSGTDIRIAMSGSNVVAVWDCNDGIYSNFSIDSGQTWHTAQLIDNKGTVGYSPIAAIEGTRVVVVWQQQSDAADYYLNWHVYSNYSDDAGESWGTAQMIDDNPYNAYYFSENARVVISGSRVIAAWAQQTAEGYWDGPVFIYSNYSTDYGETWHEDQEVSTDDVDYSWGPKLALNGTTCVMVWEMGDGFFDRMHSIYTLDGGVTWSGNEIIENNPDNMGFSPQVAMSGSNVIAVWDQKDTPGNNNDPYRIYSNHALATFVAKLTTTSLTSSYNPSLFEESVTLTAEVIAESGNPSGTVEFFDGAESLGTAVLSNGSASIVVDDFTVASHDLTVVYSGDALFEGSTSRVYTQVVRTSTTTEVFSSSNPSLYNFDVSFTAVVSPQPGVNIDPTGEVEIFNGAVSLGTVTLHNAAGSIKTWSLSPGTNIITAVYKGDDLFLASTSPELEQVAYSGPLVGGEVIQVDKTAILQENAASVFLSPGNGTGNSILFWIALPVLLAAAGGYMFIKSKCE